MTFDSKTVSLKNSMKIGRGAVSPFFPVVLNSKSDGSGGGVLVC